MARSVSGPPDPQYLSICRGAGREPTSASTAPLPAQAPLATPGATVQRLQAPAANPQPHRPSARPYPQHPTRCASSIWEGANEKGSPSAALVPFARGGPRRPIPCTHRRRRRSSRHRRSSDHRTFRRPSRACRRIPRFRRTGHPSGRCSCVHRRSRSPNP